MSRLDELIAELCPDGVEYKKLKDVVEKNKFSQIGAAELERLNVFKGEIRLLPSSKNYDWWTTTELGSKYACEGKVISLGRARYANIKYYEGKFISSNNNLISVKDENILNPKYLYYFISNHSNNFYVSTSTYPKFDSNIFDNFLISIPPIEVQNEIVRILDNFTELIAELTAELTARRKQYEYYRDKLLSFKEVIA